MRTIDSIIVAIAVDPEDDTEGVVGLNLGGSWMPLVAADEQRYQQIKALAQMVADTQNKQVKLIRFTERSECETLNGAPRYTCPDCGAVSYNLNDIEKRYCGRCHRFEETKQ